MLNWMTIDAAERRLPGDRVDERKRTARVATSFRNVHHDCDRLDVSDLVRRPTTIGMSV